METQYLPAFIKDLKSLKSSSNYSSIRKLVFEEIPSYQDIREIKNVKKLKAEDTAYRVRLGDYRIGFFMEDGKKVIFARIMHRREFYRNFP